MMHNVSCFVKRDLSHHARSVRRVGLERRKSSFSSAATVSYHRSKSLLQRGPLSTGMGMQNALVSRSNSFRPYICETAGEFRPLRSFTSSSQQPGKKDGSKSETSATNTTESTTTTSETRTSASARIASGAAAATQQLEQRLKRVQEQVSSAVTTTVNLGDQLSVVAIATFTSLLLLGPTAAWYMQQNTTSASSELDATDDPVDALAQLAQHGWGIQHDGDGDSSDDTRRNVVETVLKDVFQSKALQAAAQEFVVQILQSEPFKQAVGRLVQELWTDLVTDPETLAQVIELLRKAIEDPSIHVAAQELVLHVFVQEPSVRDALIQTLQDLGQEKVVQDAVVKLLTESTHTTLNDPEILEHSMEFATDVVGDDIVQRTAGEALRKSVGHAVRPATTVFLTSMGVGLIIFGVVAVGYSRSSEREIALFESAVKSLQSNTMYGISRMITWPVRQFGIVSNYVAESTATWDTSWRLLGATTQWLTSLFCLAPTSNGIFAVLTSCSNRLVNGTKIAWSSLQSLCHSIFRTGDERRSDLLR